MTDVNKLYLCGCHENLRYVKKCGIFIFDNLKSLFQTLILKGGKNIISVASVSGWHTISEECGMYFYQGDPREVLMQMVRVVKKGKVVKGVDVKPDSLSLNPLLTSSDTTVNH